MKKTPNPVIKLLFQVCFSPHERAALAILLIKTHITMSRLSPEAQTPCRWAQLDLQDTKLEADGHMHTWHHSWNPWFWLHPLSQLHHIPPGGEMAQEPHSDAGQVPLLSPCKSCADGDALCRATRLESFAHNVLTEHKTNHILIFCSVWNSHLHLLQLWNHRITE